MHQQTRYPVDMKVPHVARMGWPSTDPRWRPLAQFLASAFAPGEAIRPAEVHGMLWERLKLQKSQTIALLPAAEMLGLVRYYRRPDETIGVWARVVS